MKTARTTADTTAPGALSARRGNKLALQRKRRWLKDDVRYRQRHLSDRLAARAALLNRDVIMLAGLRHVGWTAGKDEDWLWARLMPMADRIPAIVLYGRNRHPGAAA